MLLGGVLTLTNCTNEVFIDLVYFWVDDASYIKAFFELRFSKEVERNLLPRLNHSLRALLDEVWIKRTGRDKLTLRRREEVVLCLTE